MMLSGDASWLLSRQECGEAVYLFRKILPSGSQGGHGQHTVGPSAPGCPAVANVHHSWWGGGGERGILRVQAFVLLETRNSRLVSPRPGKGAPPPSSRKSRASSQTRGVSINQSPSPHSELQIPPKRTFNLHTEPQGPGLSPPRSCLYTAQGTHCCLTSKPRHAGKLPVWPSSSQKQSGAAR